jgi:hypothetical protein
MANDMTSEPLTETDSGEPITRSSGHFAPLAFGHSAADPIAALYRISTAVNPLTLVAIPLPWNAQVPSSGR